MKKWSHLFLYVFTLANMFWISACGSFQRGGNYKLKIVSSILCLSCYWRTIFIYGLFLAFFNSREHSVVMHLVHIFSNNFPSGDSRYMSVVRFRSYCVFIHRIGSSCASRVLFSSKFLMVALVALFEVSKRKHKWVYFFPNIVLLVNSRERSIY